MTYLEEWTWIRQKKLVCISFICTWHTLCVCDLLLGSKHGIAAQFLLKQFAQLCSLPSSSHYCLYMNYIMAHLTGSKLQVSKKIIVLPGIYGPVSVGARKFPGSEMPNFLHFSQHILLPGFPYADSHSLVSSAWLLQLLLLAKQLQNFLAFASSEPKTLLLESEFTRSIIKSCSQEVQY